MKSEANLAVRPVECDSADFAALSAELDAELLLRYPALGDSDDFLTRDDVTAAFIVYHSGASVGCGAT